MDTVSINSLEVFGAGVWNADRYDESDLYSMVDAFSKVGFKPTIKAGHASGQEEEKAARKVFGSPALGYVDKLYVRGGKLLADLVNVPRRFAELIRKGAYRRVSSEIFWNYVDEARGTTYPRVLKSVAFLGAEIPALTNLKAIESLYHDGREYRRYLKERAMTMEDDFPTLQYLTCNEAGRLAVMQEVDRRVHETMKARNCSYREALNYNHQEEARQYAMGGVVPGGVGDYPRDRAGQENNLKLAEFLSWDFDRVSHEAGVFLSREAERLIRANPTAYPGTSAGAFDSGAGPQLRAAFADARAKFPAVARAYDAGSWNEDVVRTVFSQHFK